MFEKGLFAEVASLLSSGVTFEDQSMQGIGYKEFCGYFNGSETLDEVKETIKLNSRHYAKRQITFFKRLKGIMWLKPDSTENLADFIIKDIGKSVSYKTK